MSSKVSIPLLRESVAKLGIRSLLKLRTELQASDIPLLAVMQGGEYRSPETHPLFVRAPTGTDSEFCNTLSRRGRCAYKQMYRYPKIGRSGGGQNLVATMVGPPSPRRV